jgi:hypothetical protein
MMIGQSYWVEYSIASEPISSAWNRRRIRRARNANSALIKKKLVCPACESSRARVFLSYFHTSV